MGWGGPGSLGGKRTTTECRAEVTQSLALIIIHHIHVEIKLVICVLHGTAQEEKGAKTAGPAPDRVTWLHFFLLALGLPSPPGPLDVKMIRPALYTSHSG